jgi:hypothetical protein
MGHINPLALPTDKEMFFSFKIVCVIYIKFNIVNLHKKLSWPSSILWHCYHIYWLPLRSSGQSFWLQIKRSGFDSQHYQIFWDVGQEWGPLSLVSTIEELLWRKNSSFGLESLQHSRKDPSRWPRCTLYPQNWALTSPTSGGRSVGIVHLQTQATEFNFFLVVVYPARIKITSLSLLWYRITSFQCCDKWKILLKLWHCLTVLNLEVCSVKPFCCPWTVQFQSDLIIGNRQWPFRSDESLCILLEDFSIFVILEVRVALSYVSLTIDYHVSISCAITFSVCCITTVTGS